MKNLIILSIFALLTSCASTTILPEGNGKYSLVSTSSSESAALSDAKKKATEECQKQTKQLIVLKHKSVYQGMDKTNKAMINLAGALLSNNSNSANSSDDYKVSMMFRCK